MKIAPLPGSQLLQQWERDDGAEPQESYYIDNGEHHRANKIF